MTRRNIPGRGAAKWRTIPRPGPGARFRGYLRFSDDKFERADAATFAMQRQTMEALASHYGWVNAGWDEEPGLTGASEAIEDRPAFAAHLAAAQRGEFEVSLVCDFDRWARDTEIALGSLKRLRRAGVYWATADGQWDINKAIEDGHSIALVVDAEMNASYARKSSRKAIRARTERARAGYHNGRVTWGYQRPTPPAPPTGAPWNWRPPRQPAEPHPQNFGRLQQIGIWAAAGLSDKEIAERCAEQGWVLEHRAKGIRAWGKPFICALLTNPFPREYAPGSGQGTIVAPTGERIEGQHVAAWEWDLWHRIDALRVVRRKGKRGHSAGDERARVFSGIAICSGCGRPLHHQQRHGRISGDYAVYLCSSSDTGYLCPNKQQRGWQGVRAEEISQRFVELLLARQLPDDWREQVVAEFNTVGGSQDAEATTERRRQLEAERERVLWLFQAGHRPKEWVEEEMSRLHAALATLPSEDDSIRSHQEAIASGETLVRHRDYWELATQQERAEIVRLIVQPMGLAVNIPLRRIERVRPWPALVPVLRVAMLGERVGGSMTKDGSRPWQSQAKYPPRHQPGNS